MREERHRFIQGKLIKENICCAANRLCQRHFCFHDTAITTQEITVWPMGPSENVLIFGYRCMRHKTSTSISTVLPN